MFRFRPVMESRAFGKRKRGESETEGRGNDFLKASISRVSRPIRACFLAYGGTGRSNSTKIAVWFRVAVTYQI